MYFYNLFSHTVVLQSSTRVGRFLCTYTLWRTSTGQWMLSHHSDDPLNRADEDFELTDEEAAGEIAEHLDAA